MLDALEATVQGWRHDRLPSEDVETEENKVGVRYGWPTRTMLNGWMLEGNGSKAAG